MDGVVRRMFRQPEQAIAQSQMDVRREFGQRIARVPDQRGLAFDGVDLPAGRHQPRQQRRDVARAAADVEHQIAGIDRQQCQHVGDQAWLADGLPGVDRQRGVLIGARAQLKWDETMAGHGEHGSAHRRVGAGIELLIDHRFAPRAALVVVAIHGCSIGGCGQAPTTPWLGRTAHGRVRHVSAHLETSAHRPRRAGSPARAAYLRSHRGRVSRVRSRCRSRPTRGCSRRPGTRAGR